MFELTTIWIPLAFVISSCKNIIWSVPFIIFALMGYRLHKVSNKRQIPLLLSRISKNASYTEDDKPRGWIWGKNYIGYILEGGHSSHRGGEGNSLTIFILCRARFFKDIMNPSSKMKQIDTDDTNSDEEENTSNEKNKKNNKNKNIDNKIKFYERHGNYFWLQYNNREIDLEKYTARPNQQKIIEQIIEQYKNSNNDGNTSVNIIYGIAGTGKSMISLLLAKEMGAPLCDSFNPTEPGDDIGLIYNTAMPTYEKPLILVLEEFDILIHKLHNNLIATHRDIPIQVKDKTSWNMFFDRIDRGLYPNLIVILTTNTDPVMIDNMDKSYLRSGRINARYEL